MAVKTDWTAGQVLTASQTSTYLANAGLDYITQVTVGTAVSYVSVPSAFNSNYDNYVISCSNISTSGSPTKMHFQFEDSGGTPNTSSYSLVGTSMTWGSTTVTGVTGTTWDVLSRSAEPFSGTFEVFAPYLVNYSFMASIHRGDATAFVLQGKHAADTSFTRFRLVTDTSTVTGGTITVYGRRKA